MALNHEERTRRPPTPEARLALQSSQLRSPALSVCEGREPRQPDPVPCRGTGRRLGNSWSSRRISSPPGFADSTSRWRWRESERERERETRREIPRLWTVEGVHGTGAADSADSTCRSNPGAATFHTMLGIKHPYKYYKYHDISGLFRYMLSGLPSASCG